MDRGGGGEDGCLYKVAKLYVPKALRKEVLQPCHDNKMAGHFSFVKMLNLVQRQF